MTHLDSTKFIQFSFSHIELVVDKDGKEDKRVVGGRPTGWQKLTESKIIPGHRGFGVLTGKVNNIIGIDFDDMDTYRKLRDAKILPKNTLVVKTRRGYHYYYKFSERLAHIKTDSNIMDPEIYPKVDLRTTGGKLYGPGTEVWQDGKLVHTYRVVKDVEPTEIPDALADLILEYQERKNGGKRKPRQQVNEAPTAKKAKTAVVEAPLPKYTPEDIEKFLSCLSSERLDNYQDWLNVGFALKNHGSAKNVFENWSMKSDKYEQKKLDAFWAEDNEAHENKLTVRSLRHWAKQDDPERFEELFGYEFIDFHDRTRCRKLNKKEVDHFIKVRKRAGEDTDLEVFLHQFFRFINRGGFYLFKVYNRVGLVEYLPITRESMQGYIRFKVERPDGKEKMYTYSDYAHIQLERERKHPHFDMAADKRDNVVNTWQPMRFELHDRIDDVTEEDVAIVLEFLLDKVAGGRLDIAGHLIKWCAHLVQKPWKKTETAPILIGEEGAGKGSFWYLLVALIGAHLCYQTSKMEEIAGKFNAAVSGKLLLSIDDAGHMSNKEYQEALKHITTTKELAVHAKYKMPDVEDSFHNLVVLSNRDDIIEMTGKARRWYVIDVAGRGNDKEFFDDFYAFIEDENSMLLFYNYLMNLDISDYDPRDFPVTDLKREIQGNNASFVLHGLYSVILQYFDHVDGEFWTVTPSDGFQMIKQTSQTNEMKHLKMKSCVVELKKALGEEAFKLVKSNGVRKWRFHKENTEVALAKFGFDFKVDEDEDDDQNVANPPAIAAVFKDDDEFDELADLVPQKPAGAGVFNDEATDAEVSDEE